MILRKKIGLGSGIDKNFGFGSGIGYPLGPVGELQNLARSSDRRLGTRGATAGGWVVLSTFVYSTLTQVLSTIVLSPLTQGLSSSHLNQCFSPFSALPSIFLLLSLLVVQKCIFSLSVCLCLCLFDLD